MPHRRKISVRDKVIGKKWIYSEKNTLHRQEYGLSQRPNAALQCGVGLAFPELGRSPREGNGNRLQYSCLENPMDRGA